MSAAPSTPEPSSPLPLPVGRIVASPGASSCSSPDASPARRILVDLRPMQSWVDEKQERLYQKRRERRLKQRETKVAREAIEAMERMLNVMEDRDDQSDLVDDVSVEEDSPRQKQSVDDYPMPPGLGAQLAASLAPRRLEPMYVNIAHHRKESHSDASTTACDCFDFEPVSPPPLRAHRPFYFLPDHQPRSLRHTK
eukprot:TRINITY_DN49305_c0_g1_i1.p1 TRINITY_DN49305_c0_g1~~TRINITY_DN49305_c0_g1_i1.p1  ORF type:complete len:196 (-),score=35.14 TRINITY_DN49305_c0_g1_i1:84-671(-)